MTNETQGVHFATDGDDGLWQQFLKLTRENILDADLRNNRTRCSDALARSLRMTPETLPHTLDQWDELYHPEDYIRSRELLRLIREEESFSLDRRLYCGDGRYRSFRLDAFCLRDRENRTVRMIGTENDLSWQQFCEHRLTTQQNLLRDLQKNLENAKRRSEDLVVRLAQQEARCEALEKQLHLTRQASNATSDFLFYRDEDGRVLSCNDTFSEAAAYEPELARLARTARDEEEHGYRDRNGRLRTLLTRTYPFFDRYGKMKGEIGVFFDRTEIGEIESDMWRLRRLLWKNAARENVNETVLSIRRPAPEGRDSGDNLCEEDYNLLDSKEILGGWLNGALRTIRDASKMTGTDMFPKRTAQLEELFRLSGGTELEVGVVGITSSGKSTFINAMMGERLLPEETRATTNLVVRCRKGVERSVTVSFRNGEHQRVSGPELTATWMANVASERLNPANERDIALLEWSSPGAALPEGLVLIDTPGLDACGFPEHSELVLRQLLPSLDIVLYVTSIRTRFKSADLELLAALLEQDQRVVFLLSQIDLEQDDTEGGRVVLSRRRKLDSYVNELREDIGRSIPGEAAVVPISSKLALEHFYDRNSTAWAASNFDSLIRQMELFQTHLGRYRTETRARRALSLLSRTASDIVLTLGGISPEHAEAEGAARLEKIRELRDAWRWTNAEVSAVRNEYRSLLDPEHQIGHLKDEIGSTPTMKGMKDSYERWGTSLSELSAQMTARMDRARLSCRDILSKYGVAPRERAREVLDIKGELPAFYRYVLHEARTVRVRGWFEDFEFWPRYRTFFRQDVDREKILEGAGEVLAERLRLLNDHLTWWENRMREDCCDLLYEALTQEEAALADIRRLATDESVSRSLLRQILQGIREAERGINNIMSELSLPAVDPESLLSEDFFDRLDDPDLTRDPAEHEKTGIFAPLLAAFHEQNIQSRFLALEALQNRSCIVLLGLRRHDSVRFLSRLAHDASLVNSLRTTDDREIDDWEWILCGSTPMAMPCARVAVPEALLGKTEFLIAPGDVLCGDAPVADWNGLFAEWLPVVHLDIARIDSGLSDLSRAPYADALSRLDRWIVASGQGALFNSRLADLLTDVPDRLDDFLSNRYDKKQVDCFVYENYDARYTDFMSWGRRGGDEASLIAKWIAEGHDFAPPFSEYRLRRAIEAAGRKHENARRRGSFD